MKKSLLLLLAFFSMGLVAYGGVNVTFSVDMSIYQKNGYFNPAHRYCVDRPGFSTIGPPRLTSLHKERVLTPRYIRGWLHHRCHSVQIYFLITRRY